MKATIEINMDGAAFADAPIPEMRVILLRAEDIILNTSYGPNGFKSPILDTNGNTCGYVTVTE